MSIRTKIKRISVLVLTSVFIIANCAVSQVFAKDNISPKDNKTDGAFAEKTAKAKLYYRLAVACSKASNYHVKISDIKNGHIFPDNSNVQVGVWLEEEIEGAGDVIDGSIECNNVTSTHILDALNSVIEYNGIGVEHGGSMLITVEDLVCGPDGEIGGLYEAYNPEKNPYACSYVFSGQEFEEEDKNLSDAYREKLNVLKADEARKNLEDLFEKYLLIEEPNTFTDLELYYIYINSFKEKCETSEDKNGNKDIYRYSAESGKMEKVNVNYKKGDNFYLAAYFGDATSLPMKRKDGTTIQNYTSCEKIAQILSDSDSGEIKAAENAVKNGTMVEEGSETKHADADDKCKGTSGLGWLLCPIIDMVGKATTSLYENMIEPYLKIESKLLGDTNQSGRSAWEIFRTFANIFLIILLLVVIFSQLTGVGIDNYGIKKSLPKLIAAAVLINLSYIICQLAVDLSNLLGYSLKTMFDQFATQVGIPAAHTTSAAGLTGGIGAGVVAGSVGIITAVGAWPAVGGALVAALPTVLGALVAAIFAIFFFFVLLGARQAGVIILVALSPLAFACYILPNTKNIFDMWKKAFKGLLLLYPTAGLLIGGGNFASVVILNASGDSGGFWVNIIALLIGVVPFFYLPKAMRDSFSALGNLGNKISGFGKNMGNRARNATQERVKNSNLRNAAADKLAEKNFDKNKLLKRQRDKLDKLAQEKYDGKKFSDLDEKDKNELLKNSGVFARASAANLAAAGKSAFEANKKLQENAQYADNNFVAGAIESDTVSKQSMTDSMKKYNKDFISGIEENGKMYFADGKGGFSRVDSDGNLHSLSKEKIELAKKEGRIKKYEKRENDRYEDSEGNLLAPNHVQDAKRAGLTQSYGDLEIAKNRARNAGETAGMMAGAGEDQNARVEAARSTQFGAAQASIDDELEGNVEAVDYIEEGGEIYYGRRDGTFRTIGGHQLGATAVENAKNAGRVRRYTGMKGSQVFRDATGNPLDTDILRGARAIGATQSLASLGQTKAAEERATKRGALVGGYLGVNSEEVANAAGLGAENSAISKINQTLGDADAITVNRNAGRNTATTRTAAAQSSEVRLEQTMSGNAGAESIQNEVNAQLAAAGNIFSGPSAEQRVGRTENQIQEAVTRGSTILENQFQDTIKVNHVGEAKITPQVAEARAESKYIAQSTKNYQDQYAPYSKQDIQTEYENAIRALDAAIELPSNDPNREASIRDARIRLNAAGEAGNKKGISDNMINYVVTHQVSPDTLHSSGGEYYQALIESGEPLLASIGKEQLKEPNPAKRISVEDFITKGGLQKLINEKGTALTNRFTEETFKALNNLSSNNTQAATAIKPAFLLQSAIQDKGNGKKETEILKMLKTQKDNKISPISINLDQLGKVSEEFATTLLQRDGKGIPVLMNQNDINDLIADANKPENAPKVAALPKSIRTILGV